MSAPAPPPRPAWPLPESAAVHRAGGHGAIGALRARGLVGLVVNPAAASDVRRLTSLARAVDVHERANATARALQGLGAAGVAAIVYMREPTRIVERAMDMLAALGGDGLPEVRPATRGEAIDAAGTRAAAAAMAVAGAACVLTIGGDGTNRAVVAAWPGATVVPLPGGTNNAFAADWLDPTAAGLAAGAFARDPRLHARCVRRAPVLETTTEDGLTLIALVDVALVREPWVGARAISRPQHLAEAVVARADPALTGLSGVAGMVAPQAGPRPAALHLRFGSPGRTILAPLGPGLLVPLTVRDWRSVVPGESVALGPAAGTLAFDGEREHVLEPGEGASVRLLADGPGVLDARELLRGLSLAERDLRAAAPRPGEDGRDPHHTGGA